MLVTHKPSRGTGRLRTTAVALPCVLCLAIPAPASGAPGHSAPNGNACGHFKLELRKFDVAAGLALSEGKTSKCAPASATPPEGTATSPGDGTGTGGGSGGGSIQDPSGALSVPVLRASVLHFSGRSLAVPLACPATAPADCTGRILIRVNAPALRTRARSAGAQAARRGRKLKVGRASFRIAPGRNKTIAVQIARRGRVLFNDRKRTRAEVRLETRDSAGRKQVTRRTVRVKRGRIARR